ncbi:hypothetical protein Efla_006703 [Eimeria flavescens]
MTTPPTRREIRRHLEESCPLHTLEYSPSYRFHERLGLPQGLPDAFHHHGTHRRHAYPKLRGSETEAVDLEFSYALTSSRRGTRGHAWEACEMLDSLPVRGFNLPLPESDSASRLPSQPSVP